MRKVMTFAAAITLSACIVRYPDPPPQTVHDGPYPVVTQPPRTTRLVFCPAASTSTMQPTPAQRIPFAPVAKPRRLH